MKKLLLSLIAILSLCTILAFCTGCEHTHTFSKDWSKDETYHWHAASCEHKDQVNGKAEHTWNAGEITVTPTCFTKGEKTYTCTVCGKTKTEEVDTIDHAYGEDWSKDESGHYHACTTEGCTEKKNFAEHTWDDGEVMTAATCIEKGVKTYTCTICGQTKTEEDGTIEHTYGEDWAKDESGHYHACTTEGCTEKKDFAEHTWDDGEVTTAATCIAKGEITYTCTICGQTKVVETDDTADHAYSEDWAKDEDGHYHACTTEGCTERKDFAEHVYGDPVIVDPALNEEGSKTYTCADCGYEKVEIIPAIAAVLDAPGTYVCEAEEAYLDGIKIEGQSFGGSLGWENVTYGTSSNGKSLAGLAGAKGKKVQFFVSSNEARTVSLLIYSNALDGDKVKFEERFKLTVNGTQVVIGNFEGVSWNGQNTYYEFSKGISAEIALNEGVNEIFFEVVGPTNADHLLNFDCIKLVVEDKNAHKHVWDEEPVSVVAPQVGVEGSKTYKCQGCEETKVETVPALAADITEVGTYVCEAEEAYLDGKKIEGKSSGGSVGWESVSAGKDSSNGKSLAGLANAKGKKVQFFVSSDEARTVKLMIHSNDLDGATVAFEKRFKLTVNGEAVTIGNFVGASFTGNQWHEFAVGIEKEITLNDGINEIFFEVVGDCGDHLLNFDCIKIVVE